MSCVDNGDDGDDEVDIFQLHQRHDVKVFKLVVVDKKKSS